MVTYPKKTLSSLLKTTNYLTLVTQWEGRVSSKGQSRSSKELTAIIIAILGKSPGLKLQLDFGVER